jgi:hypothetical protein
MLEEHEDAVAFAASTVIPLICILLWKSRYDFDLRLPLTIWTVAPAVGGIVFLLLLSHGALGMISYAILAYPLSFAFLSAGWAAVFGGIGWIVGSRDSRAREEAVPPRPRARGEAPW